MKKTITIILGFMLMVMCFASCAQNDAEPVTEQDSTVAQDEDAAQETTEDDTSEEVQQPVNTDPIKVGSISGVLGTIDAMVSCKAVQIYFDEVNAAGGVNGRPLELTFYDDGLIDPANTLLYSEKLVEDDGVVAIVGPFFVLTWQGVENYYLEKNIPVIGPDGVHVAEYESAVSFPLNESPADWGATDAKYAIEELGAKNVAIAYTEGLGYAEAWAESIRQYIGAQEGIELVADSGIPNGEVNFTPTILQLKEANADAVLVLIGEAVYPGFYQELQRQDYNPTIVATPACMGTSVSDAITENLVGTIASSAFDVSADNEVFTTYRAALEEKYPGTTDNPYGFSSYLAAKLFVDTLVEMDPNNITPETILDAMNSTTSWESGATIPLTFTADDHSANRARIYFQYEGDGVWTKISDWIEIDG